MLPTPFGPTPPGEEPPLVRFPMVEHAARDLFERRIVTKEEYDGLTLDAKRAAFTVARVTNIAALRQIRDTLALDQAQGGTLPEFEENVDRILGAGTLSRAHIETLYRTNGGAAAAAGRERILNHPLVGDAFPYYAYHATHDERTEETHLALEKLGIQGTNIYRRDDPIWDKFMPPWRWRCRCDLNPLTIRDAARAGIREAQIWLETGVMPMPPAYVPHPPFEPPPGFAGPQRSRIVAII